MAKRTYADVCRLLFGLGEDLTYEDARFLYARIRTYAREAGKTPDDLLAEIFFDEQSTDEEKLDAARLLFDDEPPRLQ